MNGFNRNGSIRFPKAKSVTGVTIGGKRFTRFSQIKTKPARKIGTRERTRRGIALAIL